MDFTVFNAHLPHNTHAHTCTDTHIHASESTEGPCSGSEHMSVQTASVSLHLGGWSVPKFSLLQAQPRPLWENVCTPLALTQEVG